MTIDAAIALDLNRDAIEAFCRKWRITELSLFGSVLRPQQFREDSDVDFLATFDDAARWTLFDLVAMQDELKAIIGRNVDLVEKSVVEQSPNYIRKRHILENQKTDGSYKVEGIGVISSAGTSAAAGDSEIYRVCLCTLMLEVYYRYLKVGDRGNDGGGSSNLLPSIR